MGLKQVRREEDRTRQGKGVGDQKLSCTQEIIVVCNVLIQREKFRCAHSGKMKHTIPHGSFATTNEYFFYCSHSV